MSQVCVAEKKTLLADERTRCAHCGCLPKFWLPLSEVKPCCREHAILEREGGRRGKYPKRPEARICEQFIQTGVCRSMERNGWCFFNHPDFKLIIDASFGLKQRCSVCTLPLPCNVHFPVVGELLDDIERKFVPIEALRGLVGEAEENQSSGEIEPKNTSNSDIVEEPSLTSSEQSSKQSEKPVIRKKPFAQNEIVAAFHRGELRFARMVKDDPKIGICNISVCVPPERPRTVMLQRAKVFRLRGLRFRDKTQAE